MMSLSAVQRWVTYRTSQLWVSYRRGPLADRSLRVSGVRPGDRVPDLAAGGELGGRWGFVGADEDLRNIATERLGPDRITVLDRRGGGDAMLVRPDGHLAWRGRRPETLRRWLTRALTTGCAR